MMIFGVWSLVAAMAVGSTETARGDYAAAARDYRAEVEARSGSHEGKLELARVLAVSNPRDEAISEVPDSYDWSASLSYGFSDFSPDRGPWHDYRATLRRYGSRGSLGFEVLHAGRFGRDDDAFALDAYVDFRRRAYANLRYQVSPDAALYPDDSYRVEIFQGIGRGWEPSASYDHMDFGSNNVDMYGAGLGKYRGNWYLRWRALFVPSTAALGISHRALARYYYSGNGDDYIEVNGGFSRGGEFVRGTRIVETTRSRSFGAALQNYFHPRWGVKLSAGYDDDKDSFVERSFLVEVSRRW